MCSFSYPLHIGIEYGHEEDAKTLLFFGSYLVGEEYSIFEKNARSLASEKCFNEACRVIYENQSFITTLTRKELWSDRFKHRREERQKIEAHLNMICKNEIEIMNKIMLSKSQRRSSEVGSLSEPEGASRLEPEEDSCLTTSPFLTLRCLVEVEVKSFNT